MINWGTIRREKTGLVISFQDIKLGPEAFN